MSFTRVNPTGWVTGDLLTEQQINDLDEQHAKAIDGVGGGTYNLTAPLTLNAAKVTIQTLSAPTVQDDTTFEDNIVVEGNTRCEGQLTVDGLTNINGNSFIGNSTTDSCTVRSATEFQGNVNVGTVEDSKTLTILHATVVEGTATFNNPVEFNNNAFFDQSVNLGNGSADTIRVRGTSTIEAPMVPSGDGYIGKRVLFGVDSDATYGPHEADEVLIQNGTLSDDRVYTIDDSKAGNNACLRFMTEDATNTVEIRRPNGTNMGYLIRAAGGSRFYDMEFRRISGVWTLVGRHYIQ